ncbi:PREDICTED: probable thiol methyltransferase 2 [Tarenaya hassleriana]|uniref:probable thiol methyltransferase 2 n=1 Tax=Tarenaya hassleriana TaxID=28532 RepID=UPI00053C6CCF|nr:PREDICTED: probable thiol methyltransferase 2 [Tarenaya hassleriana]
MEILKGCPEADGAIMMTFAEQVAFARKMVTQDPSGGWQKCWELGVTPWDLGGPTPVVAHLCETDSLPDGRVLIPACGSGYDVVAMACPTRRVIGLDISEAAVERSKKRFSSLPNAEYFSFLKGDFFTWQPAEPFDLIFDYTFFCGLSPDRRPLWAKRMQELLKPGGELVTLIFPLDDRFGVPPYVVSASDYEKILIPLGFEAVSIVDNELSVEPRKGIEKLGRWKKSSSIESTA